VDRLRRRREGAAVKPNEILRQQIAEHVEHYLARGGKIQVVPTEVFGERIEGKPRAMMTSAQREQAQAEGKPGAAWRSRPIRVARR
jgi:hypothetical protein